VNVILIINESAGHSQAELLAMSMAPECENLNVKLDKRRKLAEIQVRVVIPRLQKLGYAGINT